MKKERLVSKTALFRLGLGSAMALSAAGLITGCGSTGGGDAGDQDFNGGGFVDTDGNVGRIALDVLQTDLAVAQSSGFFVRVTDANGAGVPHVRISCDTEAGLALIEPSNGFETTDSSGVMSGSVGCDAPGSYLMGCRLPVASSKREFVTIRCSGTGPDGWGGFPGAGGGGLGGDTSNTGEGSAELTDVLVFDAGSIGGSSRDYQVDVASQNCSTDAGKIECEPFFDTIVGMEVENNTNFAINFSRYSFRVFNADGNGSIFQSGEIALTNADEVPPRTNDQAGNFQFLGLFAKAGAVDGGTCAGQKALLGSSAALGQIGFKTVEFRLEGVNSVGEEVTLTRRIGMSFGAYNRCS